MSAVASTTEFDNMADLLAHLGHVPLERIRFRPAHSGDTLDGGTILPGFTLSLAELLAELDRHG